MRCFQICNCLRHLCKQKLLTSKLNHPNKGLGSLTSLIYNKKEKRNKGKEKEHRRKEKPPQKVLEDSKTVCQNRITEIKKCT